MGWYDGVEPRDKTNTGEDLLLLPETNRERSPLLGRHFGLIARASMMNGTKIFGLLAGLMLVFVLTWPLAAAEKSFDLTIPGCTA